MAERFLAIKLADLGDILTITPALRALRNRFPSARIDALVTPTGAAALDGLDSVDRLWTFEKAWFDRLRPSPRPFGAALALGFGLRRCNYGRVFLFHHLFTAVGRLKYASLLAAVAAPWRGGVAERRPGFLTEVVPDRGYGVKHEADYWLDLVGLVGATSKQPRLEIATDATAEEYVCGLLGDPSDRPLRIALYPGAGAYSPARRWPAENFAEVGRRLAQIQPHRGGAAPGTEILVVGGMDEHELAERVRAGIGVTARNLAGTTTRVKELAALLARCDLFIGNDGGAMHVASAVGVPVVGVFGPSNHISWGPYGAAEWGHEALDDRRAVVVRRDLPCAPCLYRGFVPGTPRGCRSRDCLTLTAPATVTAAALALLASARRTSGR